MERTTTLGANKTGIDMSPKHAQEMIDAANETELPQLKGKVSFRALERHYLEDAEPYGSVPLPGTAKGVAKSGMKMATGKHPETFINKLGERLAFERTGVRIYDHLISKCEFAGESNMSDIQVPLDRLREFRDEELQHFHMLIECLQTLGADPSAETPDADASGVAAMGLMKVIQDPRASVSQSLEAMLSLELTDNAAWELLIELAKDMGHKDMAKQFAQAHDQEQEHLLYVRQWYEESVRTQAKMM